MRRLLVVAVMAALLAPASADAAAPIMALKNVRPGALCTGLSVVRGTTISSFSVRILDVINGERLDSARILVRVSGPAVDATGIGPGFSGSPIFCTGSDGVTRNIGAISESIGEYGGKTVLARPIEAILADPVVPPSSRPSARKLPIGARSLATPLTVAGLRPRLGTALSRAAAKAGRRLITTAANARGTFPKQLLVPGASVAVGLTAGDIAVGAAGTVAYADGGNVWLFGHELEGAGRRSLFLQDAFVHTVVNQPINVGEEASTYKLASPGNDQGTVTGDGLAAVTGRLGGLPASFPLRVTARDLDTGRIRSVLTRVAEEGDVGEPSGAPILELASTTSVVEAVLGVLSGGPARQSGDMCITVGARELKDKMRFCNAYTVDGDVPNAFTGALVADVAEAARVLGAFRFGVLHLTSVEIGIRARRGVRQAYITGASVRGKARRGRKVTLRLRLRHVRTGRRTTRKIRIRIPSSVRPGRRTLRVTGTPGDIGSDPFEDSSLSIVFEEEDEEEEDNPGPESVEEIRDAFEALRRPYGVEASFGAGSARQVYRNPALRISGGAQVRIRVRR
ncbi:MAG: hypothetical protein M3401_00795 [Actinomycetota bacterium]|nr:hypothetical protein [Actinomycetota bacterium]